MAARPASGDAPAPASAAGDSESSPPLAAPAIYRPRSVRVVTGAGGEPRAVGGTPVEALREDWMVEDRWWTSRPLRRRYFELVLANGRCIVVFCDLERERWFSQRG